VVAKADDGVDIEFWAYDATVPGTRNRERQAHTADLKLKNAPDSHITHNLDRHAVNGPGGGPDATLVAQAEPAASSTKARQPGVYVYHCAVAPVPHHISAGMYGLIVVEPEGGLPEVDNEFYGMQGDLYFEGGRNDLGLRQFSMDKMLDERPD